MRISSSSLPSMVATFPFPRLFTVGKRYRAVNGHRSMLMMAQPAEMVTSIVIYMLLFGIVHKTVILLLLALWRSGARCSRGHWGPAGSWFVVVYMQCDTMTSSCEMISRILLFSVFDRPWQWTFPGKLQKEVQMRGLYLDLLYQDNCHVHCLRKVMLK